MATAERTRWSELANDVLDEPGRRRGAARRAVIALIATEDCCLTADEIADRLRRRRGRIGIASVYRALELLRDAGLVDRIELGEGGARYEASIPGGEHHHHLVCDVCGRITPFEDVGLERAIGRLSGRLAHRVTTHDVLIRGACERCAR